MQLTTLLERSPAVSVAKAHSGEAIPPALVLGGAANALSVVRSLGRAGVMVYVLNEPSAHVRHSRYARWIRLPATNEPETAWEAFLLGPESDYLRGAVL